MSDHDLRDTFAAAALTGLLAQGDDGSFSEESYARAAYRWADAMLAERAKRYETSAVSETGRGNVTDHDAVPAAIARTDADRNRTDKAALRPGEGTGNTPKPGAPVAQQAEQPPCERPVAGSIPAGGFTPEPVAWGLLDEGEVHAAYVFADEAAHTLKRTGDTDSVIVPLYAAPQDRVVLLTDEELEAIDTAEASLLRESTDLAASMPVRQRLGAAAATLRRLLERLAPLRKEKRA